MKEGENKSLNSFIVFASFILVAAVLYFAKAVFMPIAVAALFAFLLSPLVVRLQKWKVPKAIAVTMVVAFAFSIVASLAWLVTTRIFALAEQLPKYEQNLHAKARSLRGPESNGVFTRAANVIKGIEEDLQQSRGGTQDGAQAGTDEKPLAVEVKAPKPNLVQSLRRAAGPLLTPLATAGIVVLLVVAMLVKREDLRDRLVSVVSGGKLNVGTEALDDAAGRISRYLVMQLIINVTYGIPIGVGLYFIGVPSALLWGVIATMLRFIPFVGPWIAAIFPVTLAFAVDPGWTTLLLTVGLFIVIELISNNLVEPWLYGASTGVSVIAVIGGAIFWTWLWGGIGLFLATPLTVCLVVMGKYVPGLRVLNELFGSDCVLEPSARLYQRMLAMDAEEMLRIAEEYVAQHDLLAFYDQVMIPALIHGEEDRTTGALAEVRQQFIVQSSRELIEELGDRPEPAEAGPDDAEDPVQPLIIPDAERPRETQAAIRAPANGPSVLCVPAADDADETVTMMLVQMLRREGVQASMIPATLTAAERHRAFCAAAAESICISALPPAALAPARRLCRLIKNNCPGKRVIVGVWTPNAATTELTQRLERVKPDRVATTLRDVIQLVNPRTRAVGGVPATQASLPEGVALEPEFLRDTPVDESFTVVKREAARIFQVPISLVAILDLDREYWRNHIPVPREASESLDPLRQSGLAARAAASTEPFAVPDVSEDERCAEDTYFVSRGIQAYAVAPLRTESGHAVGLLCVFDTKPREIAPEDLVHLRALGERLMEVAESRALQPA